MKEKVLNWITENFDLNTVTVEEIGIVPAGHIITDKHGNRMLVWWDILYQRVEWRVQK